MFDYTSSELTKIDATLKPFLQGAASQTVEMEQLAMDATRLLSVRPEQLPEMAKQPFYKRVIQKFMGVSDIDNVRAQQTQLVELQKVGWRYLQILNERDLMMAHAMITLKNNLMTLSVKETETRQMLTEMAHRIADRFEDLGKRIENVQRQQTIHSWLLTLDTCDYPDKYPHQLRLLKIIQDFFRLKSSNWTFMEIKYLQQALKNAELPWKEEITLVEFIDKLIEEIEEVGFDAYRQLITLAVDGSILETGYMLEQIAVPSYRCLYKISEVYTFSSDTINVLAEDLAITREEALKKVLRNFIGKQGIDIYAKLALRDLAVELLGCHSTSTRLRLENAMSVAVVAVPALEYIHGWSGDKVKALQKKTAQALGCSIMFRDKTSLGEEGPEMVVIPAGIFLMGSPSSESERNGDEGPEHQVTFSKPFAIGRYAVTFEEYDLYCKINGVSKPSDSGWGRGKRPVINVSWGEAVRYCEWLSKKTGKIYRLPSEAEWEYACRAGTTTPFWWGSTISTKQANYDGNYTYNGGSKGEYRQKTVPVNEFQPNPLGLYQMHGNIWEWCEDMWHENYNGVPQDGSAWVGGGNSSSRGCRGGSWFLTPVTLRSASRCGYFTASRNANLGFRLARGV